MNRQIQWENENALRKYPLSELATCVDDAGKEFPTGILTGLSIVSFSKLDGPRVSSLYVGPRLVSLIISDGSGPIASATVTDVKPFSQVALEPTRPGVSGSVEFGEFDASAPSSYRFSTVEQSGILPFCVVEFPDSGITEVVDDISGESATGVVSFDFGSAASADVEIIDDKPEIVLRLSDSIARSLSNGCVPTDLGKSCIAPVIQTINGISPDEDGAIALVFE